MSVPLSLSDNPQRNVHAQCRQLFGRGTLVPSTTGERCATDEREHLRRMLFCYRFGSCRHGRFEVFRALINDTGLWVRSVQTEDLSIALHGFWVLEWCFSRGFSFARTRKNCRNLGEVQAHRWRLGGSWSTSPRRLGSASGQVTGILAGAIFDHWRILIAPRWDQVGRLALCDYWKISVRRTPLAEDLRSSQGRTEGTRRPQPTARRLMAVVWAHEAPPRKSWSPPHISPFYVHDVPPQLHIP